MWWSWLIYEIIPTLKTCRLGIWLFMSEMPFGTLSVQMLWKLFYLMHQVESGNLEKLCITLLPAECKKQLQGTAWSKRVAQIFSYPVGLCFHGFIIFIFGRTKRILHIFICNNFKIQKTALLFWHIRMIIPVFIIHEMLWVVTCYDPNSGSGNENWVVNASMELFWKYRIFDGLPLISQM